MRANKDELEDAFGREGTDVVTGYCGVIMAYTREYTGDDQYLLIPKTEDNKPLDGEWFETNRIAISDEPNSKIELTR